MKPIRPSSGPGRHQRGAALLTAMIIVTLVTTLAAAMVWQQWRAVQVEAAERARSQAAWILTGALDFARLILKETVREGKPTAMTDPWATPLAEARLSTFLAADKNNADDGPEAFLSGYIVDAQSRYNLNDLVTEQGKVLPDELGVLERLCEAVGIETSVAGVIAKGMAEATAGTAATAPLKPQRVDQLVWFGVDAASIQALRPYVVLLPYVPPLPRSTAVNLNTAPAEVLVAAFKGLDRATAERLVQLRQRQPFKELTGFTSQFSSDIKPATPVDIKSIYFEVHSRLRLEDRVLVERSMLVRDRTGTNPYSVYQRERVASLEQVGP